MKLDLSLKYEPKTVICMVGPSRSGSTIIKHALGLHPDVCQLVGEHEPYLKLAQNGYPWHDSDEFHELNNPELVRSCIANELLRPCDITAWQNRRWLQREHIEEPPYLSAAEIELVWHPYRSPRDTLLLKTPQDVYRRGIMEQLYPNAKIKYVVCERDSRAIVNGLIDGWEKDGAFEARWVDVETPTGDRHTGWWKFDMPPCWYADWKLCRPLTEIAVNQLNASLMFAHHYYRDEIRIKYEDFCFGWRANIEHLWAQLGLSCFQIPEETKLPILMATDEPAPERWRKKRPWLEEYVVEYAVPLGS